MKEIVTAFGAVLAFLVPLGIYCLILASINRRSKPLLVSGAWDSLGLLFAGSGFFLVTLPMLFSEFYLRTVGTPVSEHFFTIWLRYWILWLIYFLLLISGSVLMIVWRNHKTMIYNVDASLFPGALEQTLTALGLEATVDRRRLRLAPVPPAKSADSSAFMEGTPSAAIPRNDSRSAELVVETFPSMCHVTLHWGSHTPEAREEIEKALEKSLASAAPMENAAAGWFLSAAGLLFGAMAMLVLAVIYLMVMTRRWE